MNASSTPIHPTAARFGSDPLRLFERNPLPMWIYDRESLAFLAVNDAAVEQYGYSREQFLSMTIADIRPSEDVPALVKKVRQVTEGVDHAGVWRHLTRDGRLLHVEITAYPLAFHGRAAELVVAYDVSTRVATEALLRRQLALASLMSAISASLVASDDLDASIDLALAQLGAFCKAHRTYVFQFRADGETMDNTHEWCAAGVRPERASLQALPLASFAWSIARLRRGEAVAIPDVSKLPPDASAERAALERQAIRSLVLAPLHLGPTVAGFVGLDNVESPDSWTAADAQALEVVAGLLGNALLRRRDEAALRASESQLRSFMDNAVGYAVYRLDVSLDAPHEGRVAFASPSLEEVMGVAADAPFETWFDNIHPDDRAAVEAANRQAATQGQRFDAVMRIYHPGRGEWRWIRAVSTRSTDADGGACFNGMLVDVTDSVRAQEALKEERDFADAVMDTVSALVMVLDPQGRIVRFNRACEAATGYTTAEVVGRHPWDFLLTPEEAPALRARFAQLGSAREPERYESCWVAKDGTQRLIAWTNTALRNARGELTFGIGTGIDVTERRAAELQLRKLSSAVEQSASGVLILNRRGAVEYVNPGYTAITGVPSDALLGRPLPFLGEPDRADKRQAEIWRRLLAGRAWRGEFSSPGSDHTPRWSLISISPVRTSAPSASHFVMIMDDVTPLKAAQDELERLVSFDVLTGLPNRRLLQDRLSQALKSCARSGEPAALIYLDLDDFKRVNDSLGHEAGDALLRVVSERLRACVRDEDTVARLGGDEFVILLPTVVDQAGAARVAHKVLEALRAPVELGGHGLVVSASIGITVAPQDGTEPAALLRNGDLAMYRAKRKGRNRYAFFRPRMKEKVRARLRLEADLRQAVEHGEVRLHYQPIVRLSDGALVGAEALARWQHPVRGAVPPLEFIPLAEDSGLIVALGKQLLDDASRDLVGWRTAGGPAGLFVSVNLSARQVRDPALLADIADALARAGARPGELHVELTESLLMEDLSATRQLLEGMRELGLQVYVDDFGTGYSSLSYLKRLRLDAVKVDRSFVGDIPESDADMAITSAVIAMAHKLGLAVIAEGVETDAQRSFLRENGCERAQGYLFGAPAPAEELARRLGPG